MGEVCQIFGRIGFRGYTKEDLVYSDGAITLSPSNIVNGKMSYENCTYITWTKYEESPEIKISNNDIILVKTGSSYGKCALVTQLPHEATINPQFVVLKYILYNTRLLSYVLQSGYARYNYDQFVLGTAIPTFTQAVLANMKIPLPPQKEQIKIVETIERWFSVIDNIKEDANALESLIKKTKSKILNLAISGKLVPQDPNDEPAIELLKRINPNFVPCDNSHYENSPFEIPESWEWTTLGELCTFLSRGKSPKYSEERIYPVFAQKCNLKDGGISLEQARFLDPDTICKWDSKYKLRNGDVLVNSTGTGTVGRTRLFNESCLGEYPFVVPDSHVSVVRASAYMETKYVLAILTSQWGQQYIEENLAGSTNQKELYIGVLEDMFFPIPPLEEQRRIVDRIESLYKYLNIITAEL